MNPLFTIGHSTHEFSRFLALLKQHEIQAIGDVRSYPFSRLPWFSRPELENCLKKNGIRYVFLGQELGARRDEPQCYIGPRADYDLISKTVAFRSGIERLKTGASLYRIALVCAEKEPLDCHRTVLVCRHAKSFADVFHIHSDGHLESHEKAENRMISRYTSPGNDLFRTHSDLLEEAYKRRGEEINYVKQTEPSVMREQSWNDET